jgi:predicted RNA-binding protein with PUA-like domain
MKRSETLENNASKIPRVPAKFLLKSEPTLLLSSFLNFQDQIGRWDGIRNYQARNIQAEMRIGDLCLFYHANIKKRTGIYGIVEVAKDAYPDPLATDPASQYYDPKAIQRRWLAVDIRLVEIWDKHILLTDLKRELEINPESPLKNMQLFKMPRLSTQRVAEEEWCHILSLKSSSSY